MTEQTMEKQECRVGGWTPDGTFTGEVIRFTGEEIASYTELSGQTGSRDDRGTDYEIYRVGEDRYRVYVRTWSRWQGEESFAQLLPNNRNEDPDQFDYLDSDYGPPVTEYGTLTEAEVRARYPQVFAASGSPNVRDLD